MKLRMLMVCLIAFLMVILAAILDNVVAQEPVFDEFVYLPLLTKPLNCDFYEPNDLPEQANLIQDGETQTQCIIPKTDTDWVRFSITAESEVIIEASDEDGDLELQLYDDNLNELAYSYSGPNNPAQIDRECGGGGDPLTPGVYYARVEHWLNYAEIPSYDITLSTQECPTAVVLMNQSVYTKWFQINNWT